MGADAVPGAVRRDQVGPGVVLWRSSQLFVSRYTKGSLTTIRNMAVWSIPLCRVLWFFSIKPLAARYASKPLPPAPSCVNYDKYT